MRIGIDVCPLRKQRTGVANYMLGLLELLPGAAPAHEYFLYANDRVHGNLPAGIFTQRTDGAFRRLPGAMWLLGRCGALTRTDDLDIFWASTPVLPLRLPPRVVKIVTVYDIVWLRCPETTTRYNLLIQRLCARRAISDADYVIAISRSTQDELIHSLGVPKEKTRVIYCGVAERYKSQDPSGAAKYISRKYAVPERYLATVGIVHPRKNQHFLVKVLEVLEMRATGLSPIGGRTDWVEKLAPISRNRTAGFDGKRNSVPGIFAGRRHAGFLCRGPGILVSYSL